MQYLAHPTVVPAPPASLFAYADHLLQDDAGGSGRGAALRFTIGGVAMVFKDYHRGGLPAKFVRDTYMGRRIERTRMWREFRLLARLEDLGLPVPTPIAARCTRSSALTYRGELITRELPRTVTIAERLGLGPLPRPMWMAIGGLVRRFHDHHVFHADLNAHNILVDDEGRLHLLDFDRGGIRRAGGGWKQANLGRLERSLRKVGASAVIAGGDAGSSGDGRARFGQDDWAALLEGYRGRSVESGAGAELGVGAGAGAATGAGIGAATGAGEKGADAPATPGSPASSAERDQLRV